MVTGVIADFKTGLVKPANLLPCHVVLFVVTEVEAFGDEEGATESIALQQRGRDGGVRLG